MRRSRIDADRLQSLRPAAWTALLDKVPAMHGLQVTAVDAEPLGARTNLTRYTVSLVNHSDPISLVGKETNAVEARFYQDLAPQMPFLAPHCWFSHVDEDDGWIVIDEVPNDRPVSVWTRDDVEEMIQDLAIMHATFWDRVAYLESYPWLPPFLGKPAAENLLQAPPEGRDPAYFRHGEGMLVSEHALRRAGRLAPLFLQAAEGVARLRDLGGWSGVVADAHLTALADLLDDPMPMLQPLRELPQTLLHGNPSLYHWQVTLFEERRLLDWRRLSVGPSICDLVSYMDQFDLLLEPDGRRRRRSADEQISDEQTILDAYLVAMSSELGALFNAYDMRQALAPARCLFVLAGWLPQFATWLADLPDGRRTWSVISDMNDEQLAQTKFSDLAGLRDYLAALFERFYEAYNRL